MSEDNHDLLNLEDPPHVKLRTKISKEIAALTSDERNIVLGVATKEDALVVFFMPNGTDVVRVHERQVRPSKASNRISQSQARRMVPYLYGQVIYDKKMMEIEGGKIALAEVLLASNPYGITANDVSMRGMSAQELCGREAKTIGNFSGAIAQIARVLEIDLTAELVTATLQKNCPKPKTPLAKNPTTTSPKTTRPTIVWPVAATDGAAISNSAFSLS